MVKIYTIYVAVLKFIYFLSQLLMRNPENINRSDMKDFIADDKKVINRIRDCITTLFTKKKIMKVWDIKYKWVFDEQWNFVEWVVCTGNSCRRTWKFYTVIANWIKYDVLKEWKREYNNGLVEVWKFGEWEVFVKWERRTLNGIIYKWRFDVNTWRLYDWEIIYPNGNVQIVNKVNK